MKRLLGIVVVVVLLAGCTVQMPATPQVEKVKTLPTPAIEMVSTVETIGNLDDMLEPNSFTAAFFLADNPNDKGWNAAHYRGITYLESLGKVVRRNGLSFVIETPNKERMNIVVVPDNGYTDNVIEKNMRDVLDKYDPNIVFGTWFDSYAATLRLADEYPEALFEHISGYPLVASTMGKNGNFSTYFIRMEEGDYLACAAAGLLGLNKIGIAATFLIPEPNRGINACSLGLQEGLSHAGYNPDTAYVQVSLTNSWLDGPQETEAAKGIIGAGFPVVRQMADTPNASETACNASESVVAIGYGTDVKDTATCALGTNTWVWGPHYMESVLNANNGTWVPEDKWDGFEQGAVGVVSFNTAYLSQEQISVLEGWKQQIALGKKSIFAGPIHGYDANKAKLFLPEGAKLNDMQQLNMLWFEEHVHIGEGTLPTPIDEPYTAPLQVLN